MISVGTTTCRTMLAGAAKAHKIVKSLTTKRKAKVSDKQTRRPYSNTEEVEITSYFSQHIIDEKSVTLAEAREFLRKVPSVRRTDKYKIKLKQLFKGTLSSEFLQLTLNPNVNISL